MSGCQPHTEGIESIVLAYIRLRGLLSANQREVLRRSMVMQFADKSGMNPVEVVECFREDFWREITPGEFNRLLSLLIEKAVVWEDKLEIEFKTDGVKSLMEGLRNG